MTTKPLGIVKDIVESIGMNVSYAYEDLVFMEHNAFLLQFATKSDELLVHLNEEADEKIVSVDIARLQTAALARNFTIRKEGLYRLSQEEDENIRIEFLKS